MRLILILFIVFNFNSCKKEKNTEEVTLKDDVFALASDSFNGRQTGTEGELQAADYIEGRFEQIGLTPKGTDGNFTQTFTFKPSNNPHEQAEYTQRNTDTQIHT
ncbi:MAG: peptidase M28, partial [Marinirhabdus sp.]